MTLNIVDQGAGEISEEVGEEQNCMMQFVINAAKIVRCLLGQVVISQYIVVIVLKEKAEEMVVGLGVEEEIEAWCSWVRKLTL